MLHSPQAREFFIRLGGEKALADAFLAAEMGFVGIFAAGYGIQAATRLRSEGESHHAEALIAAPVGRVDWVLSHALIALLGSAGVLPRAIVAGWAAPVAC